MKETTGEFSMTVVTIVAIAVVAGLIAFLAPKVATYIENTWNNVGANHNCPADQVWNGSACVAKG